MKAANVGLIGLVFVVSVWAEPLLEGRVRLESGAPVVDAQVRLFDMTDLERGAVGRAMTDDTGYFALPLAALPGMALPERFELGTNYPNPFNPSTIIPYQLVALSEVRLEVFNLLGQHLATLVDGERPAGFHTATWNATDAAGRAVGAGVYIYRMTVGAASQTGRMVLIDGQAGVAASGAASDWLGASGGASDGESAQVYGLIVSGDGLVPYVDSAFRIEAGMAPVELVVSAGPYSAGKATDDDCAFCDLFGAFDDAQEEEDETEEAAETDSTSSEGGPDLIVQPPSASAVVLTPGQAFTLQVTVQNQGDDQAAATVLHYYRSNNTTISASDTQVGTGAVGELAASATSEQSIELTARVGVERYYGACVASVRGESNADNNCSSAVKITVSGQEATEGEDETSEEEEDETPEEVPDDAPVTIPDANLRAAIELALGKAPNATITKGDMTRLTTLEADALEADDAEISDLTGLDFATNLKELDLSHNRNITDISPLSGLTNLKELHLWDNNITNISPLRSLTDLRRLDLSVNNITNISALSGLTNLKWLQLGDNRITNISALRLTNLTELSLDFNQIADVSPLSGLTSLRNLGLASNNISDISALSGLTNLWRLRLDGNNISDISPLRGLTNLRELNLASNNISDISPLRGLTNLRELDLEGQLLSAASINDHIPALERSGATVRFDPPLRESDFDIELVFLDDHFSEKHKRVIRHAARRWMSIIREDLPDHTFARRWSDTCGDQSYEIPSGERIDDLRIYVSGADLPDFIVASGGPDVLRESLLPVVGCVAFDFQSWESSAKVSLNLALHEMGHVLGIGTIWDDFLQNPSGDRHFTGPRAIAAFDDAGGRNYTGAKVPVEKDGSHWRFSVLSGELMASNNIVALSAITIQALADLGYVVDVTQAVPYTLPSAAAKASAKIAAPSTHAEPKPVVRHRHRQQQEPIHVVDEHGRIIRTLPR